MTKKEKEVFSCFRDRVCTDYAAALKTNDEVLIQQAVGRFSMVMDLKEAFDKLNSEVGA